MEKQFITKHFRVLFYSLDTFGVGFFIWRESQAPHQKHGEMMSRIGPPYIYIVRFVVFFWTLHVSFGAYRESL